MAGPLQVGSRLRPDVVEAKALHRPLLDRPVHQPLPVRVEAVHGVPRAVRLAHQRVGVPTGPVLEQPVDDVAHRLGHADDLGVAGLRLAQVDALGVDIALADREQVAPALADEQRQVQDRLHVLVRQRLDAQELLVGDVARALPLLVVPHALARVVVHQLAVAGAVEHGVAGTPEVPSWRACLAGRRRPRDRGHRADPNSPRRCPWSWRRGRSAVPWLHCRGRPHPVQQPDDERLTADHPRPPLAE